MTYGLIQTLTFDLAFEFTNVGCNAQAWKAEVLQITRIFVKDHWN